MKLSDYADLMRPFTMLAPFAGVCSGALAALGAAHAPISARTLSLILVAGASAALLNSASNAFNQVCDVEVDKINKPSRPLPSGRLNRRQAELFSFALYLVSLLLAFSVGIYFFAFSLAAAAITVLYSWKAVRLKNMGWIANASIALSRGLLLTLAGWSAVSAALPAAPWFAGLIFALFLMGGASTKDFADVRGDLKYGARTLPIIYGAAGSAKLIAPFLVLPFLLFPLGAWLGMLPAPAYYLGLLSLWGVYISYLVMKDPDSLALEANHPSWVHMYLLMMAGYLGFALSFWI